MNNLDTVISFVKTTCASRDASHGWEHMSAVATSATEIMNELKITDAYSRDLITISAWLHDVADHKYDINIQVVKKFLLNTFSEKFTQDVLLIIEYISYSKEKKLKITEWEEYLPLHLILPRHVVSDADKLQALGQAGAFRCLEYLKSIHPEKNISELKQLAKAHAEDKLFHLKDNYIHTAPARHRASRLHNELVEVMKGW